MVNIAYLDALDIARFKLKPKPVVYYILVDHCDPIVLKHPIILEILKIAKITPRSCTITTSAKNDNIFLNLSYNKNIPSFLGDSSLSELENNWQEKKRIWNSLIQFLDNANL